MSGKHSMKKGRGGLRGAGGRGSLNRVSSCAHVLGQVQV